MFIKFVKLYISVVLIFILCSSCENIHDRKNYITANQSIIDTGKKIITISTDTLIKIPDSLVTLAGDSSSLSLDSTISQSSPEALVAYAITLEGSPYLYGSQDPINGFDNSGFVNYVFQHFQIDVPRSSAEFAKTGKQIKLSEAGPGDLVLFSASDSIKTKVNHVGIITSGIGEPVSFIHCTSGKSRGVVVTTLNSYYRKRLVSVREILN